MTSEFVTYEQALALKELGFDEPCFGYYDNGVFIFWYDSKQETELLLNCSAPLKQQVFRWFRNEHQFDGWATPCYTYTSDGKFYSFIIENGKESEIDGSYDDFKTYEEAESACVDKLIEIIKKN